LFKRIFKPAKVETHKCTTVVFCFMKYIVVSRLLAILTRGPTPDVEQGSKIYLSITTKRSSAAAIKANPQGA
jgi:hypothetical protein